MGYTMRCSVTDSRMQHPGRRHHWCPYGGSKTRPGCFNLGDNQISVAFCDLCGKFRVSGTCPVRGDWKRVYSSVEEYAQDLWPSSERGI